MWEEEEEVPQVLSTSEETSKGIAYVSEFRVNNVLTLELRNKKHGSTIRILHKMSCLEPVPKGLEIEIHVQICKIEFPLTSKCKEYVVKKFWLFLRSLGCTGSSGRLVGRISPKFRQHPPSLDTRQPYFFFNLVKRDRSRRVKT